MGQIEKGLFKKTQKTNAADFVGLQKMPVKKIGDPGNRPKIARAQK